MDALPYYLRNFTRPVLLLLFILLIGGSGYRVLEGWELIDCLYMTVITLSTVGFAEVHPLSSAGKIFTMGLVLSGVVFYAFTLNSIVQIFMEKRFSDFMAANRMKKKLNQMKDHLIVCGGGYMALAICEELEQAGKNFVIIEKNPESPAAELKERWPVLLKDALAEETLIEAGIERASGLAAVLSTDADNLFTVLSARSLNPNLIIQARVVSEKTRDKIMQAGADIVVSPRVVGGQQIARSFINPDVQNFFSVVLDQTSAYKFEARVHQVKKEDVFAGKTIREAKFRERGFIVIAVRTPEGKMTFAPKADTVLRENEDVFIFGPGSRDENPA